MDQVLSHIIVALRLFGGKEVKVDMKQERLNQYKLKKKVSYKIKPHSLIEFNARITSPLFKR